MRSEQPPEHATFIIADDPPLVVESGRKLHEALQALSQVSSGCDVTLSRGPKHFIKATRYAELWAVHMRRGGYWTSASFTAETTTDHSARTMQESRAAGAMWRRIGLSMVSLSPERSLSTTQAQTLFAEFFAGAKFTIPQSGA